MTRPALHRILVVNDDKDICRNLSDILSDLGYHVNFAFDGFSALELVRQQPYDVALLDLKMPGMDGLTLYREIKKQRAGTVSLLVTAYASPETADAALSAGAWKVVAKPVDFRKLLGFVDEVLDQPLVLVVDDDHDLCANLWDLFRDRGFRVCLAHDGPGAAARLKETAYRIVLIDMQIPNGNGRDVYQWVREANPEARTILITGYRSEMESLVERTIAEGADAVCYKPFHVPDLLAKLEQLAGTSRRGAGDSPR